MKDFGPAFGVANAVLYEGYLLFPYTASTGKNRVRWQFGVVVPEAYLAAETGEHAEQQTEILFERDGAPDIDILLRFLQVEARTVEIANGDRFQAVPSFSHNGTTYLTFDEAVERELLANVRPDGALAIVLPVRFDAGRDIEYLSDDDGRVVARIVRERWPLHGSLSIDVEPLRLPTALVSKLRVRVRNHSAVVAGERSSALRTSFVSTHLLLAIEGGRFLSVLDPPAFGIEAVKSLANRQTFPVLIGDGGADVQRAALVLSSPIILYDFPALGAQTEADAFDATEIDELLTLSVLSLSDEERAEARATDPRARAIVERAESFGPEGIARLHAGALHRRDAGPAVPASLLSASGARLANPFAEAGPPPGFSDDPLMALDLPAIDCVFVAGAKVARGSSVRLHPKGRADIWDSMIDGKVATVRAIHQDFEDKTYVAVTIDDDPASDLHDWYGRAFFFSPEEVEPLIAESSR
jgi:hypothetical protein